jgi:type IV secretory pathway VirB3-like protein
MEAYPHDSAVTQHVGIAQQQPLPEDDCHHPDVHGVSDVTVKSANNGGCIRQREIHHGITPATVPGASSKKNTEPAMAVGRVIFSVALPQFAAITRPPKLVDYVNYSRDNNITRIFLSARSRYGRSARSRLSPNHRRGTPL